MSSTDIVNSSTQPSRLRIHLRVDLSPRTTRIVFALVLRATTVGGCLGGGDIIASGDAAQPEVMEVGPQA